MSPIRPGARRLSDKVMTGVNWHPKLYPTRCFTSAEREVDLSFRFESGNVSGSIVALLLQNSGNNKLKSSSEIFWSSLVLSLFDLLMGEPKP